MESIPLCVPRWDEREALKEGAKYSRELGFHVPADAYLDDVWNWLPRRWKYPDKPALLPEMLPSSSWENNLRTALPPAKWDALRRHCYAAAGNRCEICGDAGRVECHERWEFDDLMCVQSLTGLLSLCAYCHKGHHLGYARRLGVYDQVLDKMRDVNSWSRAQLDQAMRDAEALATERDRFYWHVDLSWLEAGRYNLIYRLDGK
jgi:hypothetical protein